MSGKKLLSISDFEWASAAQYIVYISTLADLRETVVGDVFSFRFGKGGAQGLLGKKLKTLSLLQGNRRKLERLVGEKEKELGRNEIAVIRGMWQGISRSHEVVRVQADTLKEMVEEERQRSMFEGLLDKAEEKNEGYY